MLIYYTLYLWINFSLLHASFIEHLQCIMLRVADKKMNKVFPEGAFRLVEEADIQCKCSEIVLIKIYIKYYKRWV